MLNIEKKSEGKKLVFALSGILDTMSSPDLEKELKGGLDGVEELVFDLEKLDYISSAGLRVLILAQKSMNKQSSMVVKNCSKDIYEIFEVTGFTSILTIEQ